MQHIFVITSFSISLLVYAIAGNDELALHLQNLKGMLSSTFASVFPIDYIDERTGKTVGKLRADIGALR